MPSRVETVKHELFLTTSRDRLVSQTADDIYRRNCPTKRELIDFLNAAFEDIPKDRPFEVKKAILILRSVRFREGARKCKRTLPLDLQRKQRSSIRKLREYQLDNPPTGRSRSLSEAQQREFRELKKEQARSNRNYSEKFRGKRWYRLNFREEGGQHDLPGKRDGSGTVPFTETIVSVRQYEKYFGHTGNLNDHSRQRAFHYINRLRNRNLLGRSPAVADVLKLHIEGKTQQQIAERANLSQPRVQHIISRYMPVILNPPDEVGRPGHHSSESAVAPYSEYNWRAAFVSDRKLHSRLKSIVELAPSRFEEWIDSLISREYKEA